MDSVEWREWLDSQSEDMVVDKLMEQEQQIEEAKIIIKRLLSHAFVFPSEDTERWREAHEVYLDAQTFTSNSGK